MWSVCPQGTSIEKYQQMTAGCVRPERQHCAEISTFKMGHTWVTLAFRPGPASLAPADTQQQESCRTEAIFRQLLWSSFLSVRLYLTSVACNSFHAWFMLFFYILHLGKSNEMILGAGKEPTWRPLQSTAEIAWMCVCVCLHSTQAVQMMPLLQMERLIWQQ